MAAAFGHALGVEPEGRGHERREGLDVRAGDEDVARFQRRVVGEQAEHDLSEDLDLTVRTVAGVYLDGPVVGGEHVVVGRGPVVADVALQTPEQRRRGIVRRRMGGVRRRDTGQPQLQLPDVAAERGEQRVAGELRRRVGAAGGHALGDLGDPVPQDGGGVRQPEVHVAVPGQRGEHDEVVLGQAGGAEQRQPLRQGGEHAGSRSSAATAVASRSAGSGTPIRARRARHSSGCQRRSAGTSASSPARQASSSSGRCVA